MSHLRLLVLLLPHLMHYTLAAFTVLPARMTGNWDAIVNRRVGELRERWPNCVMNEQFIWLPDGASLFPNATVFEDLRLKATDVDSKTAITTFLQRHENGSVYWELVTDFIRDPGWVKQREALGWDWGVNNTIPFDEAVSIVAKSSVQGDPPINWMLAFQFRPNVFDRGPWPDQLYWRFDTLEGLVYLGQRDRIIHMYDPEPESASVNVTKRRLSSEWHTRRMSP